MIAYTESLKKSTENELNYQEALAAIANDIKRNPIGHLGTSDSPGS